MITRVTLRLGLGSLAVIIAAWLGLSLRNSLLTNRGLARTFNAAATGAFSGRPAAIREGIAALGDLREAQQLNPDRRARGYAALALLVVGKRKQGALELQAIARDHPQEPQGWAAIRCPPPGLPRGIRATAPGCPP